MATEATVETISELVKEGHVLIDFWGPDCAPCMAMMPAVEALGERYAGQVTLLKVKAPDNRQVCRDMRIAGLPTYITLRDGGEVERVTGNGGHDRRHRGRDPAAPGRRAGDGASRAGASLDEDRRRRVRTDDVELKGKKVIALGERDSVPGEAIAAVARSAGAEVIETRTECFV